MGSKPLPGTLSFYGEASIHPVLDWPWVDVQLRSAGTYWIVTRSVGHPHPRPVWGVWHENVLALSIGSPTIKAALARDSAVTVHLDSGTDVVVVEGSATVSSDPLAEFVVAYDLKYDWAYSFEEYGPMTMITPNRVLAWRSAGWAGRDGFQAAGSWELI